MNVLAFPATDLARSVAERAAVNAADRPLREMLRKAVVAYRAGEDRTPGSIDHRHHLAVAHAYLDAAEIVTEATGGASELSQCLDMAILDIRKLTRIARDYAGLRPDHCPAGPRSNDRLDCRSSLVPDGQRGVGDCPDRRINDARPYRPHGNNLPDASHPQESGRPVMGYSDCDRIADFIVGDKYGSGYAGEKLALARARGVSLPRRMTHRAPGPDQGRLHQAVHAPLVAGCPRRRHRQARRTPGRLGRAGSGAGGVHHLPDVLCSTDCAPRTPAQGRPRHLRAATPGTGGLHDHHGPGAPVGAPGRRHRAGHHRGHGAAAGGRIPKLRTLMASRAPGTLSSGIGLAWRR